MPQDHESLVSLGFTALEAEIYTFLLTESPATGYRVAQALGKPAANTYKAIESLEDKGAVLVEEGSSRLCRAVPAEELLGRIERAFLERKEDAADLLSRLEGASDDDGVYQLRTRALVMEKARWMLRQSRQVVLMDVFPKPLEDLRSEIEEAARRGVKIALKIYEPTRVAGAGAALHPEGAVVIQRWPGHWINLVVDGREHLLALLAESGEEVHQAVWSASPYLSWIYHSAVGAEIRLAALMNILESGADPSEVKSAMKTYEELMAPEAPGYQALVKRFGKPGRRRQPSPSKET